MSEEVSVASYVPARPVGDRCGHAQISHDGRPASTWDTRSIGEFFEEMSQLESNSLDPRLTYTQHVEYMTRVVVLMKKAAGGTLTFTGDWPEGIVIRDVIVELRPRLDGDGTRLTFGRKPAHLRLYLGEPEHRPHSLLGLKVAAKADGSLGLDEQDEHIKEAVTRADTWAREL